MPSEVARHVDFSAIRYAQCWEDADILLEALDIQEGDTCLSIASGGDNTLAMLTRDLACGAAGVRALLKQAEAGWRRYEALTGAGVDPKLSTTPLVFFFWAGKFWRRLLKLFLGAEIDSGCPGQETIQTRASVSASLGKQDVTAFHCCHERGGDNASASGAGYSCVLGTSCIGTSSCPTGDGGG